MPLPQSAALRSTRYSTLIAVLATVLVTLPTAPVQAATAAATLRLEHSDGVLAAQLYGFPARRAARVRLDIGTRAVIRRVTTTTRGRGVVRFKVGPVRKVTARVKAKVLTQVRYAAAQYTVAGGWTPLDRTGTAPAQSTASATGPFGPDRTLQPSGDVRVAVGQLDQDLLDAAGAGTRFVLAPGVHRLTERLRPHSRQQFIGEPGAIVDGSVVVSNFTAQRDVWVSGGNDYDYKTHGSCRDDYELCGHTEAVFVDGRPLWQVESRDELRPGTFVFDRSAGEIVLADDPRGKRIALAVASAAFAGRRADGSLADGVVVRNLVIQRFATMAQRGAVDTETASGWVIERNRISQNSGAGVIADSNSVVRSNRITDNGQMGIGGHGSNGLVEGNEIARNHTNGFSIGWEAGGSKWAKTDGLIVRNNWTHDNDGPGFWTDIDNIRTTIEGNIVEDNSEAGIFHEISYDAVIRNNRVRRNGWGNPRWAYGAGIQVSASPNVEVYGNVLRGNARGITGIMQNRGWGPYGLHEVANLYVHDNFIDAPPGSTFPSAMVQDIGDSSYFSTKNNRWTNNRYRIADQLSSSLFGWDNGTRSWTDWRDAGSDAGGSLVRY